MKALLFIDDEEGVRRSLVRALRHEPYRTFTAESGQEGVAFIKDNRFGVTTVISDFKMPGLDGLETLQAISALNPEITRIILTGYATMEAAIEATNAGIDGFLTKPFDNVELRAKIHEIWIRRHLRQFVCEQVYALLNRSPAALAPRLHEVTILFIDIRDFTRMSQHVPPEELVDYLNHSYFSPMGEIAYRYQGTLDKHIGDSMMVVFGAPASRPDDARRAVLAAIEMQAAARRIDAGLKAASRLRLRTGIGIASGPVCSGIMGSQRRKEFTSIGLAVNLAARLQQSARGGEILMDEETYRKTADGEWGAEVLPPMIVKGVDSAVRIYRIADSDVNWHPTKVDGAASARV
jgi:adenylate cyclase